MLEILNSLDSQIFLQLNSHYTQFSDAFMKLFSGRFIWIPMYVSLLVMVIKAFSPRQAFAVVVGIALAITLTDQTCATLIRPYVERLRPSNLLNPLSEFTHIVDGYRGGSYGFPSCHSANSFALAVFMTLLFRTRNFTLMIFSWAIMNSYSRICLGVHYPGDLLVGAVIGSCFGALCFWLVRRIGFSDVDPADIFHRRCMSWTLFATPAGFLSPLLNATTIIFRPTDLYVCVTWATVAYMVFAAV